MNICVHFVHQFIALNVLLAEPSSLVVETFTTRVHASIATQLVCLVTREH